MKKKNKNLGNKKDENAQEEINPSEEPQSEKDAAVPEEKQSEDRSKETDSESESSKEETDREPVITEAVDTARHTPAESNVSSESEGEVAAAGSSGSRMNFFVILLILGLAGSTYYLVQERKGAFNEFRENFAKIDAQISSLKSSDGGGQGASDENSLRSEITSFKDEVKKVLASQSEIIKELQASIPEGQNASQAKDRASHDAEEGTLNEGNEEVSPAIEHPDVPDEEVVGSAIVESAETHLEEDTHEEAAVEETHEGAEDHGEAPTEDANADADVIPALEPAGDESHEVAEQAESEYHEEVPTEDANADADVMPALEPAGEESHEGKEHAESESHEEATLEETHGEVENHSEEHAVSQSTGGNSNGINAYVEKVESVSSKIAGAFKEGFKGAMGLFD